MLVENAWRKHPIALLYSQLLYIRISSVRNLQTSKDFPSSKLKEKLHTPNHITFIPLTHQPNLCWLLLPPVSPVKAWASREKQHKQKNPGEISGHNLRDENGERQRKVRWGERQNVNGIERERLKVWDKRKEREVQGGNRRQEREEERWAVIAKQRNCILMEANWIKSAVEASGQSDRLRRSCQHGEITTTCVCARRDDCLPSQS